ncbi:hypothetical protein, partial [Clostridium sp.]|uniref:hypothetical protein n=1 Tax=Clostridium sp. TaxID=1506 RepID=UPI002631385D
SVLKDPVILAEGMAQSASDTVEEKGIAYSTSYVLGGVLLTKGLSKARSVSKTGETANNMIRNTILNNIAKSFNKSFDGTIYARRGAVGENLMATENSLKDASAVFVTKGSAGHTAIDRINNLALPPSNKALLESEVKLAKEQILLEGKVAPQPEWAVQAGDGIPRIGGGCQIVTNGGKWNGAVEWIKK